jgi:long-chain acyl-CoA synthetase
MSIHSGIVFNARVYRVSCCLDNLDILLGIAPLFHVTGTISHLALASLIGAPLILFYRFDPGEALRLIEKWRATFSMGAITAYIALLNHPEFQRRNLRSLGKAFSGGAPISVGFIDRFEKASGIYIHNIYGMTETTSPSHACPLGVRAPADSQSGALSIGFPVPNTYARIVDIETGNTEMPPGEVGELIVRGPMVVPGYWDKPEETQYAIRDGWLYTGDVVKMDEDGWFYLVDRKKDLINVSGFKVWPRDVEDVLYQHPAVREAAVIGVPDAYRGETVKAFISLGEEYDGKVSPSELTEFCRQRMAAYKYPRLVEIIPEIPKTLTGKFLRRVLREKELQKSRIAKE